ncbi:MFS family permease [Thermocatellispora tengchongensis]|uniref:MFS family permease n=1 Tax=Thermocatellispora tengchongensis TaxID=1073253 RepID=A0A840PB40_9ACTN|nr:MFS transporter [Thermocatellispora tengchongensis]MBB5136462.1 MFS family permease [Thermocatellispora tengchongensis]
MDGRAWGMLIVLCGAIFLEGIDVSMMGVALPSIQAELGMSTASLQWVVSAYVLGYGGFMLLGGRAADLLGRRRMFLFWLAVFVLFSGLGGLAEEGWVLVLARFVTGVGAAFLTPAGLSLITTAIPEGPRRDRALLIYAGTSAAGFSLGLVVGGGLTAIGWRWVFFAPVIVALAILLAAIWLVPDTGRPERTDGGFDMAGAVTVTAAMMMLVFAVVEAPALGGWTMAAALAAGLALLAAFVAIERRSASPLVRLGILRSVPLVRANLGAILLTGGYFGFQFIAVLYLQEARGWSPLQTGLAMLAVGADAVLAPTVTPLLVARFGTTRVIFAGMCSAATAYALFLPLAPDWGYAAMFPTMILTGVAFALAYGPLTIAATDGIAPREQGLAGGLLNTSFQFGAALGLAAVAAVNAAAGPGPGPATQEALLSGYRAGLLVPLAAALLGAAVMATGLRHPPRPAPDTAR